jgi:hypothetical protein
VPRVYQQQRLTWSGSDDAAIAGIRVLIREIRVPIREIRVPIHEIRVPKVLACQCLKRTLSGCAAARISVPWQIDDVERERSRSNAIKVDEPSLARSCTRTSQSLADKCVDQRGFPDVRPASERNFGQAVTGKVPGRRCADDKFRGDQP